jgi:hypothetical protein
VSGVVAALVLGWYEHAKQRLAAPLDERAYEEEFEDEADEFEREPPLYYV